MKRYLYLLTALFLSLIIYSCDEENTDILDTQDIQGQLLDAQGLGVPNAILELVQKDVQATSSKRSNPGLNEDKIIASDTTDEDGMFNVKEIPADLTNVVVHIIHPDFELTEYGLEDFKPEQNGSVWSVQVPRKEECQGSLSLAIYDGGENGDTTSTTSLSGSMMKLWTDGDLNRKSASGEDGKFTFMEVCAGTYMLTVEHEGYELYEVEIQVDNDSQLARNIYMKKEMEDSVLCCDASLELNVVTKENSLSVSDARIELRGPEDYFEDALTDENGLSTFAELCKGEYEVTVIADGYRTEKSTLTFDCEEEKIYTIELVVDDEEPCCDNIINVNVLDAEGVHIEEGMAYLSIGSNVQDSIEIKGQMVSFQDICEGEWRVKVEGPGYIPRDENFKLECGDTVTWDAKLEAQEEEPCCDNVLLVNPQDNEGNQLEKGIVVLRREGKENISKEITGSVVIFNEVCEGDVSLLVESEGYKSTDKEFKLGCTDSIEWTPKLLKQDEERCCEGVLRLFVYDESGNLMEGAKVLIYQDDKIVEDPVTKGDTLVVDGLCEGEMRIVIKKEGYEDIELEIEMNCDEAVVKTVTMKQKEKCCNGKITFYPKDKESGELIEGALVDLYYDGTKIREGKVDNGEGVVFDSLCEGKHVLVVKHEDYGEFEMAIEIECDDDKEISESFEKRGDCCDGKIIINITDEDGNKIEKGKIKLYKDGKEFETYGFENGYRVIEGLCEGKYGVDIESEGYETIEFTFDLGCNEELEFNKTLKKGDCCDNIVTLLINDEDGNPIDTSTVVIYKGEKALYDGIAANGKFTQDKLCEGDDYWVKVRVDGEVLGEFEFEVECDSTVQEIELKVDAPCCDNKMKFLIQDQDGNPIDSMEIVIGQGEKGLYEGTAYDGEFIQDKLCEGNYWAKIRKPGGDVVKEFEFKVECDDETQQYIVKLEKECCDNIMNLHFKDGDGNYIDSLEVEIYKGDDKLYTGFVKDGIFTQDKLCEGAHWGKVYKDGEMLKEFEFYVDCDDNEQDHTVTLEKTTCCTAKIRVNVTDKDSSFVIKGAVIRLWNGSEKVQEHESDSDGNVVFEKVCEGDKYSISILHDDYKNQEFEIDAVKCDDDREINRKLEKDECCNARMKFHVVDDSSGVAIEGAEIEVLLGSTTIHSGKTNSDGNFVTDDDLCKEKYQVKIKASGYIEQSHDWEITECKDHSETFKMKK